MGFSARIKIRKEVHKDGTAPIRLQLIINRKPKSIPLDISWPPQFFDAKKGLCQERFKGDEKAADYNLIIKQRLAKVNEVEVSHRLRKAHITMESFLLEYFSDFSKEDFIKYFENKLATRKKKKLIKPGTIKNHNNTLNKLKEFRKTISFTSFSYEFATDFELFLRKTIKPRNGKRVSTNTIWGHQRDVITYLTLARKDRINFEDPYEDYQNKSVAGTWMPLHPEELRLLEEYYKECSPGTKHRRILQKFLFSCHTSLRLGDLSNLKKAKIKNNTIRFQPQKTYYKNERELILPLTRYALHYLEDSEAENNIKGFFFYADQVGNRALKDIGELLEIETELHWHVGRETYATEFIRLGGRVEVLQKLMDHEKIETTMRYVKISEQMKLDGVNLVYQNRLKEQLPAIT
ncbi:site-specific integrase [Adhaeribacter pallidiroseus]|uniref:Tyrosine recombinase XerC n=1 Tax=Adhaeribacter pallidiroseus TaxID=2072847 RepID=A0A369QJG8_9BACT|nr:site-specific integrase [Adhaeribacter pallidiroseus]RDC65083.1 Tyrosine recombinase XerC [Adhaeribacter pallidiroseus]